MKKIWNRDVRISGIEYVIHAADMFWHSDGS